MPNAIEENLLLISKLENLDDVCIGNVIEMKNDFFKSFIENKENERNKIHSEDFTISSHAGGAMPMTTVFTVEQVEVMIKKLHKDFPDLSQDGDTRDYIHCVLLPVCCITIVMEQTNRSYNEAETLLTHLAKSRPAN